MKNAELYWKIFKKKIQGLKLRYRITFFLLLMTTAVCLISGTLGYHLARYTLIDNMTQMSIKLMKEIGTNLDTRISSFSGSVYSFLNTGAIQDIIDGNTRKNVYDLRADFNSALVMQDPLFRYTDHALMQVKDGEILSYYPSNASVRYTADEAEKILKHFQKQFSANQLTLWTSYRNHAYMVRNIRRNGESVGLVAFALNRDFFDYGGNVQEYFTNDDFVTISAADEILKNRGRTSKELCQSLIQHHNGKFYVYTTVLNPKTKTEKMGIILKVPQADWFVIGLIPYSRILRGLDSLRWAILILTFVLMAADIFLTSLLLRSFTRNLKILDEGMLEYEKGNFHYLLRPAAYDELGMMALQFNHMGYTIDKLQKDVLRKEQENKRAEIQTLQAAINPHFLYNTLGSIRYACLRKGENETADMMDAVVQLLRFTLHSTGKIIPFSEELQYIRNYVKIEQMRFDDGFDVAYRIDPEMEEMRIPGFILQPMLENSIIHGFNMNRKDNRIEIRAWKDEDYAYISESDNGIGMSEEQVEKILNSGSVMEPKHEGLNSIGINIVDKRLRNFYGPDYYMTIDSEKGEGTEITLCIPLTENEKAADGEQGKYE